jgi:penicillin-binding protein 1A
VRFIVWTLGLAGAAAVALLLTVAVALAVAYPNLPDISDLADYRPKLPLRVYSAEGALLGEFGEERRNLTPIDEIPPGDERRGSRDRRRALLPAWRRGL